MTVKEGKIYQLRSQLNKFDKIYPADKKGILSIIFFTTLSEKYIYNPILYNIIDKTLAEFKI